MFCHEFQCFVLYLCVHVGLMQNGDNNWYIMVGNDGSFGLLEFETLFFSFLNFVVLWVVNPSMYIYELGNLRKISILVMVY